MSHSGTMGSGILGSGSLGGSVARGGAARGLAPVFGALGDATRLGLISRLANGQRLSISQLTGGTSLTRQAITKHLRVLENAGLVRGIRQGRESLFEFEPREIEQIRRYLDGVSAQWDEALGRLKSLVESNSAGG
jgi:DNA-binding transcriptional ArsR family regulator